MNSKMASMSYSSSFQYPSDHVVTGLNSRFPNPSKGFSVDTSIMHHYFMDYLPTNSINAHGGVDALFVEFSVPPSRDFLDLSQLLLFVEVQVFKGDQGVDKCADDDVYSLVNGTLNAMWSSVECMLNGQLVVERNDMHGMVSYLQTMLGMPDDVKSTIGAAMGYKEGISVALTDFVKMNSANKAGLSQSMKDWMTLSSHSKAIQFCGPLLLDLVSLDSFLIDQVGLNLRLHRQQNAYLINSASGAADNYRLVLSQCRLLVRKVVPSANAHLALNKSMELNGGQRYFYKKITTKAYNIQSNELTKTIEDPFLGVIPNLLLVTFVSQKALQGAYNEDPHHLTHRGLSRLSIGVDGSILYEYQLDYDSNRFAIPYYHNFVNYGLDHAVNGLTMEQFKSSKNVYIFDLTADDQSSSNSNLTLDRKGLLRLNFNFRQAIGENLTILLVGVSQAGMMITPDRRVLLSTLM